MPKFRYLKSLQEQGEDEYLGNIWGWKNSFYGLGIILFFLSLYMYRAYMHPVAVTEDRQIEVRSSELMKEGQKAE